MPVRVIFDTNLFISYLISPVNPERTVVRLFDAAVAGVFDLIVPIDLLTELEATIAAKPHLSRAIPTEQVDRFLSLLLTRTQTLPSLPIPQQVVVRDPEDDYLLAACAIGNADVLVSGDKHLLELRDRLQRPAIMTASEFLDLITSIESPQP